MRPEPDQRYMSYLIQVAGVVLILAVFSITFTILVDPYRMYGTPTFPGWTDLKPRIYQQAGIAKTNQLERIVPKTLLLGNSRVEIGFDPESKVWPVAYWPVFNAAEAGRGLSTAVAMLREDIAVRPPRTVFLGLDFQDFLSRQEPASAPLPLIGPDERRSHLTRNGEKNGGRPVQIWRDRFATTLTLDALSDSFLTILDQNPRTAVTMTRLGFNPLHEYRIFARRTGYYGLFLAKARDYQHQYSSYKVPDFSRAEDLANFRDLAAIIALCREHGIQLIVFTQPYHANYLEMLHQLGLWPSFEQWKHAVAKVLSAADVPLYDFAEYDDFTTEKVPGRGDTTSEMRWYWEPGHYKAALGDEMLKAIINGPTSSFGRRLTPANIGTAISDVRNRRASYLSRHDEIVGKVRRVGRTPSLSD
jgi:hypothetical protein